MIDIGGAEEPDLRASERSMPRITLNFEKGATATQPKYSGFEPKTERPNSPNRIIRNKFDFKIPDSLSQASNPYQSVDASKSVGPRN